jgi:predicted TIM-barrel fold metal-dependent hydrolase
MTGDTLIVDAVVHAANLDESNAVYEPLAKALMQGAYGLHALLSPDNEYRLPPEQFLRDWSAEELANLLFLESDVDYAVYHSLPLDDFFRDGLSALEKGVALKERSPARIGLHAAINPLEGEVALQKMERYVREYGVSGIKMYPARYSDGKTVRIRLDDPDLGIPVIERAIELGVRCIAVHKYFPVGPTELDAYNVGDVEVAGRYPQINFEVLHPGFAFMDETAWLVARFPNVYINLEWTISLAFRAPRRFAEVLGTLLSWGGEDRLFWASGAMLVHPQAAIDVFRDFRMPDDLQAGYGFPALSDDGKRKIFGENWCRMHGVDPAEVRRGIAEDGWTGARTDARPGPWTSVVAATTT